MELDFSDQVAVVTGGASGIGRAMAERFGKAGMNVVIGDVDVEAPPHQAPHAAALAVGGALHLPLAHRPRGSTVQALRRVVLRSAARAHRRRLKSIETIAAFRNRH